VRLNSELTPKTIRLTLKIIGAGGAWLCFSLSLSFYPNEPLFSHNKRSSRREEEVRVSGLLKAI
jgi:hypothetical protein